MSEIRILNLCHKKSILVDIYRQSLLISIEKIHSIKNIYIRQKKDQLKNGLFQLN